MISVIVITYNRQKSLNQCIESLLCQNYSDYEIIIIDDGSKDATRQLISHLQKKHKKITYFRQENNGRGKARNLGLKKVRGSIIAFTDDDCIVPYDWLESMQKCFDENPTVAAIGGAIINGDKNLYGEVAYLLNFSAWLPTGRKRYVNDVPTANAAYKKIDIQGLSFPEERGNLDYEDTIFNHCLTKDGKKILFNPSITTYHNAGINSYEKLLENQQRKALSFLSRGYKTHGKVGETLVKLKFLNLLCPRLLPIFLRCLSSRLHFYKFIAYFPFILRGELERGLTVVRSNFALRDHAK